MALVNVELFPNGDLTGLDVAISAARALPAEAALIVMVHGMRYCPAVPTRSASRTLFAADPALMRPRIQSWPKHLRGCAPGKTAPLCVGFGWPARTSLWQAAARIPDASAALTVTLRALSAAACRPVQIIAHSLGVATSFAAISQVQRGQIGRVLSLSGAMFTDQAKAALTSPAGREMRVLNVASRENAPFDRMFELALGRGRSAIGVGLGRSARWTDLRIDDGETLKALQHLGYPVAPQSHRICHWSSYLRPGLFPLYRDLLAINGAAKMRNLSAALPDYGAPKRSLSAVIASVASPRLTTKAAAPLPGQTVARAYQSVFDPSCDSAPSGATVQPSA